MTSTDAGAFPVLLGIDAVAARLSVSPRLVKQLIQRGDLPSVKLGARRLVHMADLEEFAQQLRSATS